MAREAQMTEMTTVGGRIVSMAWRAYALLEGNNAVVTTPGRRPAVELHGQEFDFEYYRGKARRSGPDAGDE